MGIRIFLLHPPWDKEFYNTICAIPNDIIILFSGKNPTRCFVNPFSQNLKNHLLSIPSLGLSLLCKVDINHQETWVFSVTISISQPFFYICLNFYQRRNT